MPVRAALTPRLLAVYFINLTSLYGFFVILTWLPYYLQYERGFAGSVTGLVSSLVPWASVPGALLFSHLSDRMRGRLVLVRFLLPVAAVADLAPPERAATAMGFLNFAGMASSVLAPFVTGYLTGAFHSMTAAFYLAAGILLAGFVVSLAVRPGRRPPDRWRRRAA